jgi:hypothetical protein
MCARLKSWYFYLVSGKSTVSTDPWPGVERSYDPAMTISWSIYRIS